MTTLNESIQGSRERLAVATGIAILVAGLLLVTVVLPAEYAADPLGTGAQLGLLELGETGQQVAAMDAAAKASPGQAEIVVPQTRPFASETVDFRIEPGKGMEYKYRLDKGQALLYSWSATAPVHFEFHAEPDGGPRGYAQTYEKQDSAAAAAGTLTAPFAGIHGWYWENRTGSPVTVTLKSSGFYTLSHEFLESGVKNKNFN
jgi:hypothetical protein